MTEMETSNMKNELRGMIRIAERDAKYIAQMLVEDKINMAFRPNTSSEFNIKDRTNRLEMKIYYIDTLRKLCERFEDLSGASGDEDSSFKAVIRLAQCV